MALKNNYFDPKIYSNLLFFICILICCDILLNSFTQFLDFGSTNIMYEYDFNDYIKGSGDAAYSLMAFQFLIQIIMIFSLLSIFSKTFFFKYGMVNIMCKKFKLTFIVVFIYPIFYIAERFFMAIFIQNSDTTMNEISIWSNAFYIVLYILKFVFAFIFYITIVNSCLELGKSKYYKSDPMLGYMT